MGVFNIDVSSYASARGYLDCMKITDTYESYDPVASGVCLTDLRAVIVDGVTIGYWCCSASPAQLQKLHGPQAPKWCEQMLERVSDRYCSTHTVSLANYCVIQPCTRSVMKDCVTCDLPEHVDAMAAFMRRKNANFQLASRIRRTQSKLPTDTSVHLEVERAEILDFEADKADRAHKAVREPEPDEPVPAQTLSGGFGVQGHDPSAPPDNTLKAPRITASRRRTHNMEVITFACGLIYAWKAFFFSESPSAVKVSSKRHTSLV